MTTKHENFRTAHILIPTHQHDKSTKTQMAWACSPTWCVIARRSRRQDYWETYEREKETTADEQHMRRIRNSKETSWRQMSVMCLSDGSHWAATTAEYQKKKKTYPHSCLKDYWDLWLVTLLASFRPLTIIQLYHFSRVSSKLKGRVYTSCLKKLSDIPQWNLASEYGARSKVGEKWNE